MAETEYLNVRIRLQDARRFMTETAGAGGTVRAFGNEVQTAGKKTEFARAETFAWRQGIFTLRRELYGATVALGLVGAGALKMGYDFDQAKTKGTTALTGILGSAAAARVEMNALVALSESSGLSLSQLTDGAERLMEFGASAKEANAQLAAMSHFAGVRDLGASGVSSLVSLFNQIRTKGFVDSRSILAFKSLGINAQKLLADNLPGGLTPKQIAQLQAGKLAVPTQYAIPALTQGLAKTPGSEGVHGLIGQVRSTAAVLFGDMEQRAVNWAQGLLPKVAGVLQKAATGFQHGGARGMFNAIDPSGTLANTWTVLGKTIRSVGDVLKVVAGIVRALSPVLSLLGAILGLVAAHGTALQFVVYWLTIRYLYLRSVTLLTLGAQKLLGVELFKFIGITKDATAAQKVAALWQARSTLAAAAGARAQAVLTAALRFTGLTAVATAAEATAAWIAVAWPILLVVAIVVGVIALVVVLYKRWSWFHNLVQTIWGWIRNHWPLLLEIITAPFTGGLSLILTHIGMIKGAIGGAFHWIERQASRVVHWLTGILHKIPGYGLISSFLSNVGGFGGALSVVGLADGGTVTSAGHVLVGERGPELLSLPRAARVTPLDHSSVSTSLANHIRISVEPADLTMDGKKVGDVVFAARATVGART